MPCKNFKISSENEEFRGGISRSLDEKFVIFSRNFKIMAGKQVSEPFFVVRSWTGSKKRWGEKIGRYYLPEAHYLPALLYHPFAPPEVLKYKVRDLYLS